MLSESEEAGLKFRATAEAVGLGKISSDNFEAGLLTVVNSIAELVNASRARSHFQMDGQ